MGGFLILGYQKSSAPLASHGAARTIRRLDCHVTVSSNINAYQNQWHRWHATAITYHVIKLTLVIGDT